jgi:hypothetical protein
MKLVTAAIVIVVALVVTTIRPSASGPVGIYGIIERVVFEPSEQAPERVQLWGVFAYVNTAPEQAVRPGFLRSPVGGVTPPARGYLYFKVPDVASGPFSQGDVDRARLEWRDLASVARTGQAVGFGRWGYIGNFAALRPEARADTLPYLYERAPQGGNFTDLRVRPASEAPASPATYQTNAGVVKLSAEGSHARIVEWLTSEPQP